MAFSSFNSINKGVHNKNKKPLIMTYNAVAKDTFTVGIYSVLVSKTTGLTITPNKNVIIGYCVVGGGAAGKGYYVTGSTGTGGSGGDVKLATLSQNTTLSSITYTLTIGVGGNNNPSVVVPGTTSIGSIISSGNTRSYIYNGVTQTSVGAGGSGSTDQYGAGGSAMAGFNLGGIITDISLNGFFSGGGGGGNDSYSGGGGVLLKTTNTGKPGGAGGGGGGMGYYSSAGGTSTITANGVSLFTSSGGAGGGVATGGTPGAGGANTGGGGGYGNYGGRGGSGVIIMWWVTNQ
jgi:hypothetical protein